MNQINDVIKVNTKEEALALVTENCKALMSLDAIYQDDQDIVMQAVKERGLLLKFASESLKDDKNIVLEAVKRDGDAFEYASNRLRGDREILLTASEGWFWNEKAFQYASEELRSDREVVLEGATCKFNPK